MDDHEFEDAAELVGTLGKMMKRKDLDSDTPRIGMGSPDLVAPSGGLISGSTRGPGSGATATVTGTQRSPQRSRRAAEAPPISDPAIQAQSRSAVRSRATPASKSSPRQNESDKHEGTPRSAKRRSAGGGSQDTTPQARHVSVESGTSTTPRAPQGVGGRSPATPSTVRSMHHATGSGGSQKGTPIVGNSTPITPSAAATLASDAVRRSPNLRRSPPSRSPTHESPYSRQQR